MSVSDLAYPISVLATLLALLLASLPLLRRWQHRLAAPPDALISLRASHMLDRSRRLLLVECDGARLVVLTGGSQDIIVPWPGTGGTEAGP